MLIFKSPADACCIWQKRAGLEVGQLVADYMNRLCELTGRDWVFSRRYLSIILQNEGSLRLHGWHHTHTAPLKIDVARSPSLLVG